MRRKGPRPIHVTTYVDWKPGRSSISHPRWGKVCRVVKEVNQLNDEYGNCTICAAESDWWCDLVVHARADSL